MITLAEWKIIGITLIILFFMSAIAVGMLQEFFMKMKNKTQKRTRKQITHKVIKIDLCDYLMANMKQEFIGQRKMILNQLVRM